MTVCGQDIYQSDKKIFLLRFTFCSVIRMQIISFWVIPRRLSSNCRRFGTHYRFHLHRQVNEVCILHSPAYEDGTFRTRLKLKNKIRIQMNYTMVPRTHVAPTCTAFWTLLSIFMFWLSWFAVINKTWWNGNFLTSSSHSRLWTTPEFFV